MIQYILSEDKMTEKEINDLINDLVKLDSKKLGDFICLLSHKYIKSHKMKKDAFIQLLNNNLSILDEEDN